MSTEKKVKKAGKKWKEILEEPPKVSATELMRDHDYMGTLVGFFVKKLHVESNHTQSFSKTYGTRYGKLKIIYGGHFVTTPLVVRLI